MKQVNSIELLWAFLRHFQKFLLKTGFSIVILTFTIFPLNKLSLVQRSSISLFYKIMSLFYSLDLISISWTLVYFILTFNLFFLRTKYTTCLTSWAFTWRMTWELYSKITANILLFIQYSLMLPWWRKRDKLSFSLFLRKIIANLKKNGENN